MTRNKPLKIHWGQAPEQDPLKAIYGPGHSVYSDPIPNWCDPIQWASAPAGWQQCPVCNGSGAHPDQRMSVNSFDPRPTCNGKRIISIATGQPPQPPQP